MAWQNNIYAWLLLFTAIASTLIAVLASRRYSVPGTRGLFWLMVGVTIWALGYALELSMTDLRWQIFWAKVEYLGILSAPVLWFIITLQYTRRGELLTRRNIMLLALEPVLALIFVWTNEFHRLVWSQWQQKYTLFGVILDLEHGLVFYLIVAYAYLMMFAGAVLLVVSFARSNTLYQRQSVIIILGAAAPWIGNALYVSGLSPFPDLDLTPFSFAITGMVFSWGLFRFRLLDVVPVVRSLMVESMRDAMMVFDSYDRLLDLNLSAQQLIESSNLEMLPKSEKIVKRHADLIGKTGREAIPFWDQIEGCLHDVGVCGDLVIARDAQPAIFEVFKTTIFDRQHKKAGILLALRDVSQNRRVETDLSAARLEADTSSHEKSAFLANMGHELHTPLSEIVQNANLLLESARARNDTVSVAQLNSIQNAAEQSLMLITDVMDYTRLDSKEISFSLETFDVRQMALEAAAYARDALEKNGNRLEVEIASVGAMRADRLKVQQILANLLDNAARFTQNGRVCLEVVRQTVRGSDRLVFSVSDSGIGIEPEHIPDIFKPFVRLDVSTSNMYNGTGFGLALSQRLCRLMGGEITAESTPGEGSLFCFWLPAKQPLENYDLLQSDDY